MSLLEVICKELGVEIGENWLGNDGFYYCINPDGQIDELNKDKELLDYGYEFWEIILLEKLKPVWKPKKDEIYYVPTIDWGFDELWNYWRFDSSHEICRYHEDKGMICKTKEEAIEMANKMLESIK